MKSLRLWWSERLLQEGVALAQPVGDDAETQWPESQPDGHLDSSDQNSITVAQITRACTNMLLRWVSLHVLALSSHWFVVSA